MEGWLQLGVGYAGLTLRFLAAFLMLGRIRPLLGGGTLFAVAGTLAAVSFQRCGETAPRPDLQDAAAVCGMLFRNLSYGVATGLSQALVLEALPMVGRLCDTMRGSQTAEQLLPGTEIRSSPLESATQVAVAYLFFASGAGMRFIGQLSSPTLLTHGPLVGGLGGKEFLRSVLQLSLDALCSALQGAAPVLIVLFVCELCWAMLSRFAAALQLGTELAGVRLLVGLFIAALVLPELVTGWSGIPATPPGR